MMAKERMQKAWDWQLFPEAERFVRGEIGWFLAHSHRAQDICREIEEGTSTRVIDWTDHLRVPDERAEPDDLLGLGFTDRGEGPDGSRVFLHEQSTIPPVLVAEGDAAALALRTDGLDAMQGAIGLATPVLSEPYAPLRTMEICRDNGFVLSAVERRGSAGFFMEEQGDAAAYREALAAFAARPRLFEAERDGMAELGRLIAAHARELAPGRLADAFFRAEREYWEERNAAARIQRVRQDRFGLGWGNHDHHTFRSSREQFRPLLEIFTRLGFAFREQFHAGARAGWGAQVMEHPEAGLVVFADVDLSEEEQDHDFVRQGLVPRNHRGTVGLWVALHGEGILAAGMHHLAVRVRFDAAHGDLPAHGARMMEPFSYLRFLKQAFTEAELWPVDAGRAARLVDEGVLSSRQAMGFVESGALGSHLEIIQRDRGFRGFNQGSVSAIIRETDPRLEGERGA